VTDDFILRHFSIVQAISQRMRLEEVNKALTYYAYEDVAPAAVLDRRRVAGAVQYLVAWRDGAEDAWVGAEFVSEEVRARACCALSMWVFAGGGGMQSSECSRAQAAAVQGSPAAARLRSCKRCALPSRAVDAIVPLIASSPGEANAAHAPVQVVQDYEKGLEYADAVRIKGVRRAGDAKEYLIQWADGAPDSWESEDDITRALVTAYEQEAGAAQAASGAEAKEREPVAATA
jgi:hypothetical protein